MARLSPQGKFRALDSNGDPLSGGKLYAYEAGTSTPKDTYTTEDESVANANPVILDANGYADVWLASGSYKLVLTDSADVTQWTVDDVSSGIAEGYLNTVVSQSTNLNVTSAYQNNLIVCTAALTLSLLPASTAGEGFVLSVKNTSAGNVTIDPDGSETIDGSATLTIGSGCSLNIVCDGTNWFSIGVNQIGQLSDVIFTSETSGDVISYNGSDWVNQANTIDNINDVNITSVADEQVLTYDSGSGDWINADPSPGIGGGDYATNSYTNPNTAAAGGTLTYTGTSITKTSDTSKVIVTLNGRYDPSTATIDVKIRRGGSVIATFEDVVSNGCFTFIDEPSGTAGTSVGYDSQVTVVSGSVGPGSKVVITLAEI